MGLGTSIVLIAQALARRAVAVQTPHPPLLAATISDRNAIEDAHDRRYTVAPHLGGAAVAGWMTEPDMHSLRIRARDQALRRCRLGRCGSDEIEGEGS